MAPAGYEDKKGILALAAGVAGCLIGFSVERTKIDFSTDGLTARSRILRVAFGVVTLLGIYLLSNVAYYAVVGESTRPWTLVLYVLRYGLVALWASAGAPWLFKKLYFI